MTRRTKIIIAAVILVILIALALWWALWLSPGAAPQQPVETTATNAPQGTLLNTSTAANLNSAPTTGAVQPSQPDPASSLRRLASSFAERYGSFSSLADYENLSDLRVFMTARLAGETDSYIAAERRKPPQTQYYGMTTRAISTDVSSLDESGGNAVIIVKTQRQEFKDPRTPGTVRYQELRLTFTKQNGAWKVDVATWL